MDNLLGLASSNPSSRGCSPARPMNPHPHYQHASSKHGSDTPSASSSGGLYHSRHRRKSPEVSHNNEHSTPITYFDDYDDEALLHASHLSNGSNEQVTVDEPDAQQSAELARQQALIKTIQGKIERTKNLIRTEQTSRDDNVNEYLKLAANADKQQIQRIKAVFEKKNQKSAHTISQLQKKLEGYNKKIRDVESMRPSSGHRQPREVLRDMGQGLKNVGGNIRDGISGFSGGVVENIKGGLHGAAEHEDSMNEEEKTHHGSATLPGNCTLSSGHGSSSAAPKFHSDEECFRKESACSSATSESNPLGQALSPRLVDTPDHLKPIYAELHDRRQQLEQLNLSVDLLKTVPQDLQYVNALLVEERFRFERLEEQVNDLTELHQNEVENLKQALSDMEEKVQYQSEERLRDIHEMLDACHTKISKMEHQQAQHQQYLTLEGLDNSNARALVVKLINILLTVLQVVLLLVATGAGIIMPFLKTRLRMLSTLVLITALVFALKQWPELRDVGDHLLKYAKNALSGK